MPTIDPLTKLENKFSKVIQRQAAQSEMCRDIVRIAYEEGVGNPVYLSRKVFETCVRTNPDLSPASVEDNLHTLAATLRWHRDVANGGSHRRPYRFTFSPPPSPSGVTINRRLALCAGRFGPGHRCPPIAVVLVEELPPELSGKKSFRTKPARPLESCQPAPGQRKPMAALVSSQPRGGFVGEGRTERSDKLQTRRVVDGIQRAASRLGLGLQGSAGEENSVEAGSKF
jgi:hypothetical protein